MITAQRAASVLDLAMAFDIDSLFQWTFVHLCEVLLAQQNNLPYFDHCFMEHLFAHIDKKGLAWSDFCRQVQRQLAMRFQNLQHFTQLMHLPARVFSEMLTSDNLQVDEEQQVINLII